MARYIDIEPIEIAAKERGFYSVSLPLINEQPTADVVERKRGKWTEKKVIEDRNAIEEWQSANCSVCGKYHTTPYMYYFDDFAYCPNCGARMGERREKRGEDEQT